MCPIRHEVMSQGARVMLAAELAIPANQVSCRRRPSESMEVHRKERNVRQNIADPKVRTKRKTVEDPWTVIEHIDVIGEQVAVAIADVPLSNPLVKQFGVAIEVLTNERSNPDGVFASNNNILKRFDGSEVVAPSLPMLIETAS
jgi:hypothetical protein